MLHSLGVHITRNRASAMCMVTVLSLLPAAWLPTLFLAIIVMSLVTLHRGLKEGAMLATLAVCCIMAVNLLANSGVQVSFLQLWMTLFPIVLAWLLAGTLGATNQWIWALYVAVLCGVCFIAVFHMVLGNHLSQWWIARLHDLLIQGQAASLSHSGGKEIDRFLSAISHFTTGIFTTSCITFSVLLLILARTWQSALFNPGGLQAEWKTLRLHPCYAVLIGIVACIMWLLKPPFVIDIFFVLCIPPFFCAWALCYALLPANKRKLVLWLLALVLFFVPQLMTLLVLLSLIDSYYNFRAFRKKRG